MRQLLRKLAVTGTVVFLMVAGTSLALAQETQGTPASRGEARGDVQTLRARAAAFWAARVARDFRAQWELLEPRVKGSTAPEDYSAGRGAVRYLAYQVEDAIVNGPFATVKMRVLAQPATAALAGRRIVPQATLVDDPWIRVGGIWYRRLESEESGPPQEPTL